MYEPSILGWCNWSDVNKDLFQPVMDDSGKRPVFKSFGCVGKSSNRAEAISKAAVKRILAMSKSSTGWDFAKNDGKQSLP
jgi:hypothetical protein